MRKHILAIVLCLLAFQSIEAQNDKKAVDILKKVQNFYQSRINIESSFTINIVNEEDGINELQNGTIYIQEDQYRFESNDILRVSDGYSIWTHFKNDDEIQITEFDPDDEELTPPKIFSLYEQDYNIAYKEEKFHNGEKHHEVDLYPETTDNPYSIIRILINARDNTITEVTSFGRSGTKMIFRIYQPIYNQRLDDTLFKLDASLMSLDVIDLR